jgi:glycosyltransferase involved in cell wall biosynthesis
VTIALDATYSLGEDLSGVGVYSRELLLGLAGQHPETRFTWCYRPHRYASAWGVALPPNCRRGLLQEPWGPRRADLFHGLNQRLPKIRLRRAVVTFHDLFVMTGEYSTPEFRARFTAQARDAAARAAAIATVSAFTAAQVRDLLGVEPARVFVVHHGVRGLVLPPRAAPERIVLHVGAVQKRKNLARLVEAFEALDDSWQLVLAGAQGFGAAEVVERIRSSPARERIRMTGYVTAEELGQWYSRAAIFAFPSLDEGFGMPVLEAMTAGVPVLAARRAALPEVAGDAALLVDPEDIEALRAALLDLARNEDLRADLARRGREHAAQFTWDRAASETWAVYQTLLVP